MAKTMLQDVQRIRSLIDGIASHCETVAKEYAKAVDRHGQKFTEALAACGLERAWLHCLYDVGRGLCAGGLLFLSPDKRDLLRCQDLPTQQKIIDTGVNNKPLDRTSIDSLRVALGVKKRPTMSKRVPVKSHIRSRPHAAKAKPVASSYGVAITEARVYSWLEFVAIIEENAANIPQDIIERMSRAVSLATV